MRSSEAGTTGGNALLHRARYEIIPLHNVHEEAASLPAGATVTVTGSPRKGIEATLYLSQQLSESGFYTVQHIMARLVRSRDHLCEITDRIVSAGLKEIFIIGGDVPVPSGPYYSSLDLIRDMAEINKLPLRIGIAAYPEGHLHTVQPRPQYHRFYSFRNTQYRGIPYL